MPDHCGCKLQGRFQQDIHDHPPWPLPGAQGLQVLAVDLDPQASLTSLHGALPDFDPREDETLYAAIRFSDPKPTKSLVQQAHIAGFDVICAGLDLTEFETAVALEMRKNGGTSFLLRVSQALE